MNGTQLLYKVSLLVLLVCGMVHGTTFAQTATPLAVVEATIAVERAIVFPTPDRTSEPLTYLYQRETVPVFGQSPDGLFLLTTVSGLNGWILRAQVDLSGAVEQLPVVDAPVFVPTATFTPFLASPTPGASPSMTPFVAQPTPTQAGTGAGNLSDLPPVLPGKSPPLTIDLPDGWDSLDIVVSFSTFSGELSDIPLTIYFGPLPGGATGYIYLYWGFPNVVTLSGEYNLWADGVQLLRGSLVGDSCNLGVYEQKTFTLGGLDAVGASYQTDSCEDETNTAGWFGVVRVYDGSFAFYTAVEPLDAIAAQRPNLQAILDSVEFLPPETD